MSPLRSLFAWLSSIPSSHPGLTAFIIALWLGRRLWFNLNAFDCKNRLYLITGAASGLGKELAVRFSSFPGACVAIVDLNERGAVEVSHSLSLQGSGRHVRGYGCDVTDSQAVSRCVQRIEEDFGRPVDVLVNNAGTVGGTDILHGSEASILRTFHVNAISHAWTLRACLPAMKHGGGGGRQCALVTVASASALLGVAHLGDYAASKAAAYMLHESTRAELKAARDPVHTLLVCPYFVSSGLFQGVTSRLPWPGLLPIGTPAGVADRIVCALQRGEEQLCIPWLVYTVPLLRALLPVPLFDAVAFTLGIHASMDTFKGKGREREKDAGGAAPRESAGQATAESRG